MKRKLLTIFASLALSLGAASAHASQTLVLASSFDLDGEAADADQVVVAATLADSTTFTIAAQPDVCRLIDASVVDANSSITVGTLTITGTDCWDYPLVATFDMSGGSGTRTGTVAASDSAHVIRASGAYFKTITSVVSGVLTGEGGAGDTLAVGYTSNSQTGYPMYGRYTETPSRRMVDIFGKYDVQAAVTSGTTSVDIKAVSSSTTEPFQNVSVNDMLIFNIGGEQFMRRVVTRTDGDNVVVNQGITISATGVNFSYKKFFYSTDPIDGWIPVGKFGTVDFQVQVDANADTGGVTYTVDCASRAAEASNAVPDMIYAVDSQNVATSSTGTFKTVIDLWLAPDYQECRAGLKFGTGDDGDSAVENVDLIVGVR